jgi:translation initiation factor IF-3
VRCGPHLPGSPWRSRTVDWIAAAVHFFYPCEGRNPRIGPQATCGGPRPIAFRELRVNDQIRIPNVRLFDDTTQESLGIVPIERARQLAAERELDLVEVAPQAQPPVCRLMDYGRYKFEALKREKESRKEHNVIRLKEMKLRPKISEHDFQTKYGYVRHFLADGDKVKLTIMFRGREMVHQEYGRKLLDRMAQELKDVAIIERNPLVEGRNMIMILSPLAKKQAKGTHHAESAKSGAASGGRAQRTRIGAEDEATAAVAAVGATTDDGDTSTARSSEDAQDSNP